MSHKSLALGVLLLWGWTMLPAPAPAAGRHVAVIVDTSGSMNGNDPPRYTMQLSKILSDLLDENDELTVVRMANGSSCSAGVSSALALRLDPSDRGAFKAALAAHTECNTGTHYSAAVRTAVDVLSRDPGKKRLLLMLADSGGFGRCGAALTRELEALRDSGATIAAVNIGLTAGAFDSNPALSFTTAARDSQELVASVGLLYQRFLGAKEVQTGEVDGAVEVEIPAYVREAYLVVAADGPIRTLEQAPGNPRARDVDLNVHGGGESLGRDGRNRGYRIARLLSPDAGRWTFKVPGLAERAGWMLIFDSALGVRMVARPSVARGLATPLEFEVYDLRDGARVTDPEILAGLDLTVEHGGRTIALNDQGRDGDRQAGDGILTATVTFDTSGRQRFSGRLGSDLLDRGLSFETEVVEARWDLDVETSGRAEVGSPVDLFVALRPFGDAAQLEVPERVDVLTGGTAVELGDAGTGADEKAGDLVYSGVWTPPAMGTAQLEYVPRGGVGATPITVAIEVLGRLELGTAPIDLGRGESKTELAGEIDLTSSTVRGTFDVELSSDFALDRAVLEVDLGQGWEPLGEEPRSLRLSEGGALHWPLRLRIGSCPEGCPEGRTFAVRVAGVDAWGQSVEASLPLAVVVAADSWWTCWWPVIATVAGLLLAGVVVHGYWTPSRFAPRLGLMLSPEEDMNEGFFHPIRAQRGSGAGFYRDAAIYVLPDFRLSAKAGGALARMRAAGNQVRLRPMPGIVLWRQNVDGEWEKVAADESRTRFGTIYRDDLKSLFFTVRNG